MTIPQPPRPFDAWNYHESTGYTGPARDLLGYHVEATDGSIGHIAEATGDADGSFLVVDTGPWILGHKVMVPAGVINTIDTDAQKVYLNCSRDQIKAAPPYDPDLGQNINYRDEIGNYYTDAGGPIL